MLEMKEFEPNHSVIDA